MKLTYEQLEQTIASDEKRYEELSEKLEVEKEKVIRLKALIQNDATAISYQTMAGYRQMLINELNK